MGTRKPPGHTVPVPTVTIYQHGEHVAGVVQQHFKRPLVTDETFEDVGENSDAHKRGHTASGGLGAEGGYPFLAKVGLQGAYQFENVNENTRARSTRAVQNFVYSQAYYLNLVRDSLREENILKTVSGVEDALDLKAGDFVEYRAIFRPSEMATIMDVVTPELVDTIVRTGYMREQVKLFEGWSNIEEIQMAAKKAEVESVARGELAAAITRAVKTDFRSTTTREYYGSIGGGNDDVTAVTICDTGHFTVDDEDRILDGEFTVLGKVTSGQETDAPILRRNKLLSRIMPEGVDALTGLLSSAANGIDAADDVIDMNDINLGLRSRVEGPSFRVVPLAIYV